MNAPVNVKIESDNQTKQSSVPEPIMHYVAQLILLVKDMIQRVSAWNQHVSPEGRVDLSVLATLEKMLAAQMLQIVIIRQHTDDKKRLLAQLLKAYGYGDLILPPAMFPLRTRLVFHDIASCQILLHMHKPDQTEQVINLTPLSHEAQQKKIQEQVSRLDTELELELEIILPPLLDFPCIFLEIPDFLINTQKNQLVNFSCIHSPYILVIEQGMDGSEQTWQALINQFESAPFFREALEVLPILQEEKQIVASGMIEKILPALRQICLKKQFNWMRTTCQQFHDLQKSVLPRWEKYQQQLSQQLEEHKIRYTTTLNEITFKKTVLSRERAVQEHRVKIESEYFSEFYTQELKNKILRPLRFFRTEVMALFQQEDIFVFLAEEHCLCLHPNYEALFYKKIRTLQETWQAIKFDMKQQLKSWHVSFSNVDFKQMATLEATLEASLLPLQTLQIKAEALSPWCLQIVPVDESHLKQIQSQRQNLHSKISHFEALTAKTEAELFALQHRLDLTRQRLEQIYLQVARYQQPVFLHREKTMPLFGTPFSIEKDVSPFSPIFQRQAWDEEKRRLDKTSTEYTHAIQHLETKITWLMEMKHIHALTKREYQRQLTYLDEEYQKQVQRIEQKKEQCKQQALIGLKTHIVQLLTTQIEDIEQNQVGLIVNFYHQYSEKLIAIVQQTYLVMEKSLDKQLVQMHMHYETLREAQEEIKEAILVDHFPKMKACLQKMTAFEQRLKQICG